MKQNPVFWIFVAFCIVTTSHVSAETKEITRYTDDEGNTVFTDQPQPHIDSAETITVNPAPSFILPTPTYTPDMFVKPKQNEKPQSSAYSKFEFTTPTDELSVRSNEGIVPYNIAIEPGLNPTDQVKVTLDGKEVSEGASGNVTGVFRGAHVFQAEIVNKSTGQSVQKTTPVTIYLHKINIKKNRPAVKPAVKK